MGDNDDPRGVLIKCEDGFRSEITGAALVTWVNA